VVAVILEELPVPVAQVAVVQVHRHHREPQAQRILVVVAAVLET